MAKFNRVAPTTKVQNVAGGEGYSENPKLELAGTLLTSFVKDQAYRSESEVVQRIVQLIKQIPDKKFCAKAALFARNEYGMRSVSHIVAGEVARHVKGEQWTRRFFDKVIHRIDDMSEIVAYYSSTGKLHPLPNSLKKGFRSAIERAKPYELAKYRGEGKEVSLVDLVNLVHPHSNPALKKLMKGELKSTQTWESKLTQAGQKAENKEEKEELKKEAWEGLLKSGKLGYFALLRNLRNIMEQAPKSLDLALEQLVDRKAIKGSLVLPFRFQTAMEEIAETGSIDTRKILTAISKAADIALDNCPELPGRTLVALDESGSMRGKPIEVGSLFAAVLYKHCNSVLLTFSERARFRNFDPNSSALSIAAQLKQDFTSGGTNFISIFQAIAQQKFDRIVILSDMQGWMGDGCGNPKGVWGQYKRFHGVDPFLYSFNLNDYGTLMFPEKKVFCISGWSDKIFDTMKILETDRNALIRKIEEIEI